MRTEHDEGAAGDRSNLTTDGNESGDAAEVDALATEADDLADDVEGLADRVSDRIGDAYEDVVDEVDDAVDENPWIEKLTVYGWYAKGLAYSLMGVTAFQIARVDQSADDEASPSGAIGAVADFPAGRFLMAVFAVGLLLYSIWRLLSVAVIRGSGLRKWGDRIGFMFSAVFYLVLAWTAISNAVSGADPGASDTVEGISTTVLGWWIGRPLVGLAGIVTIAIGIYFGVHKGIQRSFAKHLDNVDPTPSENLPKRRALVYSGIVGWIGRGIVTALVGFFVLRSAWRFDPNDARGFDRSLRYLAGTGTGSALVVVCAVGLVAYGIFCVFSARFREIEDNS